MSKYRSKHYPNLIRRTWTSAWVFRKYSSEKGKEFEASTGIPAEDRRAAEAYKIGLDLFNDWLGSHLPAGRVLIKDLARAVLASKESKKGGKKGNTYRSAKNQIENHVIPAFGHLRPEQITTLKWETYDAEERQRVYERKVGDRVLKYKRTKLFNTRKFVLEILNRAYDEKLIKSVPNLKNHDSKAKGPRKLDRQTIRQILKCSSPSPKLLAYILWKQGPRPGEALQYRFSMIRAGKDGRDWMHIPGEITKTGRARSIPMNSCVARVLRRVRKDAESDLIFPSPKDSNVPQREYKTAWKSACRRAVTAEVTRLEAQLKCEENPKGNKELERELVQARARLPERRMEFKADIYNLRDTFISERLEEGFSSVFIGKYCDTSGEMIDRKYAVAGEEVLGKIAG
jgi:hypothetical protein